MAGLPHGGFKIGDVATWADERCRVIGLYEGCDEIVIELLDEPGGFGVLWWSVWHAKPPSEGKKCPYCSEIITNDFCGCDRTD